LGDSVSELAVATALYRYMSATPVATMAPAKLFGEALCIYIGGWSLVIGLLADCIF
jgi:hypothetical protein